MQVDSIVAGAGVVGLAIARSLALSGRDVLVLEAAETYGSEISSRNSEVIHAGIYYPAGSLKAQLCVAGRQRLYRYCGERQIAAPRLGKLIVATNENQVARLGGLHNSARRNGVSDLEIWSRERVAEIEPHISCRQALFSPSTGILDSHAFMRSLVADLEDASGHIAYRSPFVCARHEPCRGLIVEVGGNDPCEILAQEFVNACGLSAGQVAANVAGTSPDSIPAIYYARGCYFQLSGYRPPFSHLIYPLPEPGGLGLHATIDLAGQVRFGPDVEWIDSIDYGVEPSRAQGFYAAIRDYWPGLPEGALQPAYAGIRPKISGPGEPPADFAIRGPGNCGVPGVVHLFGIESPGLTASLAIADLVAEMLNRTG